MTTFLKATAAAAILSIASVTSALAEGHGWKPEGPIKMMIAFAAGGGADTHARLIAEDLQAATGWEIVPEQVTGKGGVNALVALKEMPADGTAIAMVVTESIGYNAAAAKGAGISPSDFTGLTTTAGFQMGVVAKAEKGWTSFEDMIAAAKEGELRFGTMSPKLSDLAYLLGEAHGVEFNIVQVRGGKAVMNGVQAGDMDLGFMAGIQGKGVASGDLVNLASALSEPLKQTPDAPTFADLGVSFNADGYFVFVAPAGMDPAAREALTAAIVESTNSGKANGMITKAFGGPVNIQGAELDALFQSDFEAAGALMEAAQ
ncbi:tripartite tricarboxylate transporter substrate-binding protein [Sulfitobacter sp. JBTF-M27]|uniref:Tripartite tricarboxylate transporter substrate-binding protein n=1 Tax=Sulfitobacter sediminilitoris TaxID=2698830 RepID=A0A6P0CEJ3_9RHOB|nr:tripartite tricarboxylate transporter substrate-binding protein [Sulfitobacter sediminilitoris]NEK24611.1 tripartite tricarboxylate transporter substrate-binding protein [Sulfitobacter sediminilitoris]